MAVYVDRAQNRLGRMKMSHMLADTLDELHDMAGRVGLRRAWFQNHGTPHYDLCQQKRTLALEYGAVEIGNRQVVAIIRQWRAETQRIDGGGDRVGVVGDKAESALENPRDRQNLRVTGDCAP